MTKLQTTPQRGSPPKPVKRGMFSVDDTPTLWIIGVGALALVALLALLALDVLALLVVAAVLFGLERTAGDWLADALGPFLSKVVFVGGVVLAAATLLSFGSVRDSIWSALAEADDAGFHSVLVDQLRTMPSAGPIVGDGVSGGGGGLPQVSGQPAGSGTDDRSSRSSASAATGQAVVRTRAVLRLGGQGGTIHFAVDVIATGVTVDEGDVEFSIDGRRVTTARVTRGRAEAQVRGITSGAHRASARFRGTSRFGESIAEAAFTR
jgi:hypothetical protein